MTDKKEEYVLVPRSSVVMGGGNVEMKEVKRQVAEQVAQFVKEKHLGAPAIRTVNLDDFGEGDIMGRRLERKVSTYSAKSKDGIVRVPIFVQNYMTVGTSAALEANLQLAPSGASEWTNIAALYGSCRCRGVEIEVNWARYWNKNDSLANRETGWMVGWDHEYLPAAVSWAVLSDYSSAHMVNVSDSKLVHKFKFRPVGWIDSNTKRIIRGWQNTDSTVQSTLFVGSFCIDQSNVGSGVANLYYRVRFDMEFKFRQ